MFSHYEVKRCFVLEKVWCKSIKCTKIHRKSVLCVSVGIYYPKNNTSWRNIMVKQFPFQCGPTCRFEVDVDFENTLDYGTITSSERRISIVQLRFSRERNAAYTFDKKLCKNRFNV